MLPCCRCCPEPGKQPSRQLGATSLAGHAAPSRLFYVTDRHTKHQFLVDTGAEVSVIPPTTHERANRLHGQDLQAANASPIATYGERSLTLDIGLRRPCRWVFIVAEVRHAIIGADFRRHFNFLVDVRNRRLIDATTNLSVNGKARSAPAISPVLAAPTPSRFTDIPTPRC